MKKKAVVLLSGGLDSTTVLAMAIDEGYEPYALSFDYGQRHLLELESARLVAARMAVAKHLVVTINMQDIGGSALTDRSLKVPKDRIEGPEASSIIPVTYVPARNTIFLSFALAWAEAIGAFDLFIGVNALDYSGYPDCRPEYIRAYEAMANLAVKAAVEGKGRFAIQTPLIDLTKGQIIQKGLALNVDYSLTWSCYDPAPEGRTPCMRCDSCLIRAKGFAQASAQDPLAKETGSWIRD